MSLLDTRSSHARLFALLCAFRIGNALLCRTFFQPDEYYQTLEIAHRLVFGYGYATWEWRPEPGPIRSPLAPLFYTLPYWLLKITGLHKTDAIVCLRALEAFAPLRAGLQIWLPKAFQGLLAAWVDFATFKLALRVGSAPQTTVSFDRR
jgi:phosphatidylinositol glycan class B